MPDSEALSIRPIARVVSPYREKFGIPRQPGLVASARGWVEMLPGFDRPEAFEGLEGFSHLWLIFGFHACEGRHRMRVRPPRLGGNREVGVFASRSPFRPNGLGLSLLRLEEIVSGPGMRLRVSGLDLLDGTPVYDIKPYLPYADRPPAARAGFAPEAPEPRLAVRFVPEAARALAAQPALRRLIEETLALDPRPAYRRSGTDARRYGMRIADREVRWRVDADGVCVLEIGPAGEEGAPPFSASD